MSWLERFSIIEENEPEEITLENGPSKYHATNIVVIDQIVAVSKIGGFS